MCNYVCLFHTHSAMLGEQTVAVRLFGVAGVSTDELTAPCVCVFVCVDVFRENGFCISALVSSSSPPSPSLSLVPLSHFLSPPIILILH